MASGIVEPPQSGSGSNPDQPQGKQPSRAPLVQRLLAGTSSLPNFIQDLIRVQAHIVAGTEAAAFLLEPAPDQPNTFSLKPIAHIRDDASDEQTRTQALEAFAKIIQPCIQQQKDGVIQIEGSFDGSEHQFCLVTPLRSEGKVVAASAVVARARDAERAQQRLEMMKVVSGYFDVYTLRRQLEQNKSVAQSHQHVLMLATSVATAEGFDSAAMNLCNELSARTGAVRVSIGWVKGEQIKLKAISHSEQFDKKQDLSVQIVRVMEECLDNDELVQYDPDGATSETVTREAQSLSTSQGGHTVLSLPLRRAGDTVGVMTLEFASNQRIGPDAARGLAVAADLLAPQLYDRFQNDRYLATKVGLSIKDTAAKVAGPKYMLPKTVAVCVIALLLVIFDLVPFVNIRPMYHVKSSFELVPKVESSFDAPMEGILEKVFVRPGDVVEAGQVLLKFKTLELEQERDRYNAERAQAELEMNSILQNPREDQLAQAGIAQQRMLAAQAQMKLMEIKIAQAEIKAPFAGTILNGDLRDKEGAPFRRGDPMMKMAPKGNLEAKFFVAERDIQDVKSGLQKGSLAVASAPSEKFDFKVIRIVPEASPKENVNVFEVFGEIENAPDNWLPRQVGDAKIEVGPRRIAWIWLHRFSDWAQIKVWQYKFW